jgi:hypothetical protein
LSHAPKPFCSSYFSGRASHFSSRLARTTILWDGRCTLPHTAFLLRWVPQSFCPG